MANGMTFNSTASSTLHLAYCVPKIPLLPERKPSTIEIQGRDGTVDFENDSYAPRLIPVECLTDEAASIAVLDGWMADIALWLSGTGYLVFDGDTTKRWRGKVYNETEMEFLPLRRKFTVVFQCDPYAEDVTETVAAALEAATDYGSDVEFYPEINISLYDLVNQCTNGDFPTVTTGWAASASVLSIASAACVVTGDGSAAEVGIYQDNAAVLNVAHKYYVRATVKVTNADCQNIKLDYDGSTAGTATTKDTQATPENGTTYVLSALDAPPADATGTLKISIHHDYADAATANTKVMTLDNVFVIDVTNVFGAGTEPNLATMDGYVSAFLTEQSVTHFTDTAATYVQTSLVSTGEYVRIEDTFANGDDIIINMGTGKATKNATSCMADVTIASLFFGVPTGTQTITVTSDGFYVANMDYRKRYLYA